MRDEPVTQAGDAPSVGTARELVLVVDDERDLTVSVEHGLRTAGFDVLVAWTGGAALELARSRRPALVLLDWMLPDVAGTEVCRRLKADPTTADTRVMMVSARSEEVDRVVGFEVGADDYVTKPFSLRELVLRARAVLRRSEARPQEQAIAVGELVVDPISHRVTLAGVPVGLTALEFRLLQTLLTRPERVLTRETLLQDVWGLEVAVETRTVDTHVKRLREKLGSAGAVIETVRGVGYRFSPPRARS